MNEDKSYTTEDLLLFIDKLRRENKQLKEVIDEVMEKLKLDRKIALSLNQTYTVSVIDSTLQILDKAKDSDN